MSLRETLNRLLQHGKISNVKMTKTVIEHDSRECNASCAVCQQVKQEIEAFSREFEDFHD